MLENLVKLLTLFILSENDWVSFNNTLSMPTAPQSRTSVSENYSKTPSHRLVHVEGVQKPCVYCRDNQNKTKSGWKVYTHYKCEACNVALCKPRYDRLCFALYHQNC